MFNTDCIHQLKEKSNLTIKQAIIMMLSKLPPQKVIAKYLCEEFSSVTSQRMIELIESDHAIGLQFCEDTMSVLNTLLFRIK